MLFHPRLTYIANANHRANLRLFGIKKPDRRYHCYIIGKTGVGKSTLLKTLLAQDLARGEGCGLFDPHGDLVESVVPLVPLWRRDDLVHLNVPASNPSWHFNPLQGVPAERHAVATAGIVETFKKIWPDGWGPRLEHVLRNVVFTLLETPGSSFADISRLVLDKDYRNLVVERVTNKEVRRFWKEEYDRLSPSMTTVVVAPILNKVGAFMADPVVREILTGHGESLNFREIIDRRQILLVNLAKGRIGEGPAQLLGSLLVSSLALAGLSRQDQREEDRQDFFLYLDEFHTFATLTLSTMLAELRKYRVSLILAHQYFGQLGEGISDAVLGNAGSLLVFRVGGKDAPLLARELQPKFETEDLVNLPNYSLYLRLMIDGQVSKPFSAETALLEPGIANATLSPR